MRRIVVTLLAPAVLLGGAVATAATTQAATGTQRYVDIRGTNAGDCTNRATPCLTVQYAVDRSVDGDTVNVRGSDLPYVGNIVIVDKSVSIIGHPFTDDPDPIDDDNPNPTFEGASASPVITYRTTPGKPSKHGAVNYVRISPVPNSPVAVSIDNATVQLTAIISAAPHDSVGIALAHSAAVSEATVTGFVTDVGIAKSADARIYNATLTRGDDPKHDQTATTLNVPAHASARVVGTWMIGGRGATVSGAGSRLYLTRDEISDSTREGVVALPGSTVLVDTSTIYHNGHYQIGSTGAKVSVRNSTILDTGAIGLGTATAAGYKTSLSVWGSVISGGDAARDCTGAVRIADSGYNSSQDAANPCKFSSVKHDLLRTDPKLARLARNGGPNGIRTQLPAKDSPLLNRIPVGVAGCTLTGTDQRDQPRLLGPRCDIGSVEGAVDTNLARPAADRI